MHNCPHCQKPSVSSIRLASLGPARSMKCRACGGRIGVPYGKSFLAMTPFLLGMLLALISAEFVQSIPVVGALIVVGAVATLFLWLRIVPLEKR